MTISVYPFTSPVIMTDTLFTAYGGLVGTTTVFQRQAAYLLAEEKVSGHLETLLVPTTVTGTFDGYQNIVALEYGYVNRIDRVRFLDDDNVLFGTVTDTNNLAHSILNSDAGIIDAFYLRYCASVVCRYWYPYSMEVVYNVGFATGTSTSSKFLLALTSYSQIILNEIAGYGNEGVGDIGVQTFQNQGYQEVRKTLLRTDFGNSAKAQFINSLLDDVKKYRYVGI